MILSSWEKREKIQPRYEYFEELLDQLKNLVRDERRNLMAVTKDIFLWGKLWSMLRRIEKASKQKRERLDVPKTRKDLARMQNLIEEVVEGATERFSFTLNQVVRESVKIVRVEKSQLENIKIEEQLDEVGNTIRFSYDKFKDWQRVLTNLLRNAIEAVEAKQSGAGDLGLVTTPPLTGQEEAGVAVPPEAGRGGGENCWVKVSTKPSYSVPVSVSVIIEDSGIGMDEATKSSFYKKGFTSGKEGGLGLGVSEESVQLIEQYGNWEIESQKGVGTKITINIDREKAREAEQGLGKQEPFFRTKLAFGLSLFLLALIGLALLFVFDKYSRFWVDWNPALVKFLDENTVVVQNKEGSTLWDRQFPQEVEQASLALSDLNKDGRNEVLLGTRCGFRETGYVYCFSFKGRELWKCAMGAASVFGVSSDLYSVAGILVRDLNLDGEMEIVVQAGNYPWFPNQTALLNKEGEVQSNYWHSGVVNLLFCDDIDNDDTLEVVLRGVNNSLKYSAVLIMLDYKTIRGQSPPYGDEVLPKAQEKVYIKFPFIKGWGGENGLFSVLGGFGFMGREDGFDVYKAAVHDHRGIIRHYWLDEELMNVKRITLTPDTRFALRKLKQEGILDYDITPEVIESWKQIEVWKNGVKIR